MVLLPKNKKTLSLEELLFLRQKPEAEQHPKQKHSLILCRCPTHWEDMSCEREIVQVHWYYSP